MYSIHKALGLLLLAMLLLSLQGFAAIGAKAVWEVRTTATADTNGGAFVAGSTPSRGGIAVPAQPSATCTNTAGGFANQANVYVVITFTDAFGETAISPVSTAVTNCTNGGTSNKLTITAPASAPGCQTGTTCTWNAYICGATADAACQSTGPWAVVATGTGLALGVNKVVAAIPALSGTQPSGTDYSQQDGPQIAVTNATTNATTTVTSSTAAFTGLHAHNVCYISGGAGVVTTQWREIVRVSNSTTIILDAAIAQTTTADATLNCGGALASPGRAGGSAIGQNWIFIKAGTYKVISASSNISGGVTSPASGTIGLFTQVIGYSTNRIVSNSDTKPLLQACADASAPCTGAISSETLLTINATSMASNISVDCNSTTSSTGVVSTGGANALVRIKAANCTTFGVDANVSGSSGGTKLLFAEAVGNSGTAAIRLGAIVFGYGLEAHGNSIHGIVFNAQNAFCVACLSYSNTATSDGFNSSPANNSWVCVDCVAYANGLYGFNRDSSNTTFALTINSIAEANTNVGFFGSGFQQYLFYNNAGYHNNSSTTLDNQISVAKFPFDFGFINNTTGSFFTNAAGGDFSLNSTVNQGALARAAGVPGVYPAGTTTGYIDIGAAQHADPAGGGGASQIIGGGL